MSIEIPSTSIVRFIAGQVTVEYESSRMPIEEIAGANLPENASFMKSLKARAVDHAERNGR